MLDESNTLRNEESRRADSTQEGGEGGESRSATPGRESRSGTATSTAAPRRRGPRDEGRGGWRGRSGHGRRFDDDEEERKPRLKTPAAQVKPFNFEFDDPDAQTLTRDEFLQQVMAYDETLRDFGEGEIVKGSIVGIG